eukprot:SAG31_NODE_20428_length_574_cov_4.450526_1_plen_99_part_01
MVRIVRPSRTDAMRPFSVRHFFWICAETLCVLAVCHHSNATPGTVATFSGDAVANAFLTIDCASPLRPIRTPNALGLLRVGHFADWAVEAFQALSGDLL